MRGDTCNCDGAVIFEHQSDFPDYESCRKKCIDTEGCYYFGLWEENIVGFCRLWKTCGSCNKADFSNKVYQLSSGIQINFVVIGNIIFSVRKFYNRCVSYFNFSLVCSNHPTEWAYKKGWTCETYLDEDYDMARTCREWIANKHCGETCAKFGVITDPNCRIGKEILYHTFLMYLDYTGFE